MTTYKRTRSLSQFSTRCSGMLLAVGAMVLPACGSSPTDEAATPENSQDDNVTTAELSENITSYLGETVTIRGELQEVVGNYTFMLNDEQLFGGADVLVINASGEEVRLVEGDDTELQVTGEVREFLRADIEREFGLTLDPELYADYEQQPAIIGQSVALAPDPADITANPEKYYSQRIALQGEVETVYDANAITMDEEELFGGEDLLVIDPQGQLQVQEDEDVIITGTLRPFVISEFEQDYDLTWDLELQQQIEAEYENRPVFIADEVYPAAM